MVTFDAHAASIISMLLLKLRSGDLDLDLDLDRAGDCTVYGVSSGVTSTTQVILPSCTWAISSAKISFLLDSQHILEFVL